MSSPEIHSKHEEKQTTEETNKYDTKNDPPQEHSRTPHEQDFEEYVPEFKDTSAEMYKTPEQQFVDLHDRLQGMVGGFCWSLN